jgi:hypothetical protein
LPLIVGLFAALPRWAVNACTVGDMAMGMGVMMLRWPLTHSTHIQGANPVDE